MRRSATVVVSAMLLCACANARVRSGVVPGVGLARFRRARSNACDGLVGERLGSGLNRRGFDVIATF